MPLIAEKLEAFLLAVGQTEGTDQQVDAVVRCMHAIEEHEPILQSNENSEVILEITRECQKKCAQYLRTPMAECVRSVIAAARKRLATKAALDSEASYQHSQRHLNTLVELLGTWSNIVAQCRDFGFSRTLTKLILSPLYSRIVEAAVETFRTFKKDKELDQWSVRLLDEGAECNVASLDGLVAQVATFRTMLHQHYAFHYSCFQPMNNSGTAAANVSTGEPAGVMVESMLIVAQSELQQWRELDAMYVSLEFGFLQHATQQALKETTLIPIETDVLIPQCVEDVFFIFSKVCDRAVSTGSENNVFSVVNRFVEFIRYTPPGEFDRHSVLYRMVCSKALYRKCVARKEVSQRALQRILHGPSSISGASGSLKRTQSAILSGFSTPTKGSAGAADSAMAGTGSNVSTPGQALAAAVSQTALGSLLLGSAAPSPAPVIRSSGADDAGFGSSGSGGVPPSSPALGIASALSDAAAVSLTGVNWWLADQLSPYLSTGDAPSTAAGGSVGGVGGESAGIGGIAMQGTPPKAAAPSSGGGYSTPNGSGTASSAVAGMHRPPVAGGGGGARPSPPPSASSKFSTKGIAAGPVASAATSSNGSALSLDELLLNALVGDDEDGSDGEEGYYGGAGNSTAVSTADSACCSDSYEFGRFVEEQHSRLPLREGDWVVQVNTLCTIVGSIQTLQGRVAAAQGIGHIYESAVDRRGVGSGKERSSPISILLQELSTSQSTYLALLDYEAQQLARWTFLSQLQYSLHKFCTQKYEISGQEMETRAAEDALQVIVRRCLGITAVERYREEHEEKGNAASSSGATTIKSTGAAGSAPSSQNGSTKADAQLQPSLSQDAPSSGEPDGQSDSREAEARLQREKERARHGTFLLGCNSRLSQGAYVVVLRELCTLLASYLTDQLLLKTKFSEWGALLLYQEVISLTQYVEALVDHLDETHIQTVKQTFASLNLALKILTLDAPGDIRRYTLSKALLTEERVRAVLGRRVEFPAEAVARVKLTMIDTAPP